MSGIECKVYDIRSSLKSSIKNIWSLEHQKTLAQSCVQKLPPSGCIDFTFYYSGQGALRIDDAKEKLPNGVINGQKTTYDELECSEKLGILSVVIRPSAARLLLGLPVNEVANQSVSVSDIYGIEGRELEAKVVEARDNETRIKVVEDFFELRLRDHKKSTDPRVKEGVRQISFNGGQVRIDELARHLGISKRQLERVFSSDIGVSPKNFSKTIRFQYILSLKQKYPEKSLVELAYDGGYSDQAHFIKDFKSMTGYTPREYFSKWPAVSDYYSFL